jgi:hypothetical protein
MENPIIQKERKKLHMTILMKLTHIQFYLIIIKDLIQVSKGNRQMVLVMGIMFLSGKVKNIAIQAHMKWDII